MRVDFLGKRHPWTPHHHFPCCLQSRRLIPVEWSCSSSFKASIEWSVPFAGLIFNTTLWFDNGSSHTLQFSSALERRSFQARWTLHTIALRLVSSASTPIDCMATCSSQSRSFVVDRTVSSPANFAHQLSMFDAFEALQRSEPARETLMSCSHSFHIQSSFERRQSSNVSLVQQTRHAKKSNLSHTFPL
jgi:hypothetical protein